MFTSHMHILGIKKNIYNLSLPNKKDELFVKAIANIRNIRSFFIYLQKQQ